MVAPASAKSFRTGLTLGVPVLKAFGRVAWIDGGKRIALGQVAPDPLCLGAPERLFRLQGLTGLVGRNPSGDAPAVFDSGFVFSFLNFGPTRFYSPETKFKSHIKYAIPVERDGKRLVSSRGAPKFRLTLGSAPIEIRDARAITPIETGTLGYVAWFGADMLKQTGALVYDFDTMTYAAVKKGDPRIAACMPQQAGSGLRFARPGLQFPDGRL